MKTPNPESPGPSASLAETEEISKVIERDPDLLQQWLKDIPNAILLWFVVQPKYGSHNKKITYKILGQYSYCLVTQNIWKSGTYPVPRVLT